MATHDELAQVSGPLERVFFSGAGTALLEEWGRQNGTASRRDRLRGVVRIQDEAFLGRLDVLGIRPEACLAIALVPLVLVAWADGSVDERERKAFLESARRQGVAAERIAGRALENALSRPPAPQLFDLWAAYVRRLWICFTADEQWRMRKNLLDAAREVAEATGSFLGLTSGISAAERDTLERIQAVLDQA